MVNYNIDDGNGSGSNDSTDSGNNDGDDQTLKITSYAAIDGVLEGVFPSSSDYGQSIALRMDDVELVDGALYDRGDGTYKLFSWDALGLGEDALGDDEVLTEDMAPSRYSETFGQTTYSYKLIGSRVDDVDESGDTVPVGNIIMFEGASEYGPNSSAKTISRTLSDKGRDAVVDEDDQFNWLDESIELRSDLEGVEVRYFKIQRPGEEYSFDLPVFTHMGLNERITIDRTSPTESSEESSVDSSESETTPSEDSEAFSDDVQEFVDELGPMGITEPAKIKRMLESMAQSEDIEFGSLDDETVDRVIEAIQNYEY